MSPAISFKAALAGFRELGLSAEHLLAPTGLTLDKLSDPFAAIPNDAFAQLWAAAYREMPDPTLPTRSGFAVPFSEFGLLDHLVDSASTVGEGLLILNQFLWLVASNLEVRFSHDAHDWVWVVNTPPEPFGFISEQWTLALIYQRYSSRLPAFTLEEVHLSQDAEVEKELFEALWGVPVRLGQKRSGMRLSDGVWATGNTNANPGLQRTLLTVAERVEIKQLEEAPLIYAIRTRLPEALEQGTVSAETIAAELGLSKRTLQRRLSAQSTSFKDLLDAYRQEQAMLMLQNGERDMGSVAYALGYNEQSSFNRAFRRWTQQSPSAWLQSQS